MQSNKAPKKTRKIADESPKPKNTESAEMGFANHQHKTGSPAAAEAATAENTPVAKRMAAAAGADVAAAGQRVVTRDDIAKLAHSYWAARGYVHGSADADWLRAERELGVSR